MNESINPEVLYALQEELHGIARGLGWYDRPRSFPELISLFHAEVSEALEAYIDTDGDVQKTWYRDSDNKPEGVASELADTIIRILDASEALGIPTIDLIFEKAEYNKTRPYRHGNKVI